MIATDHAPHSDEEKARGLENSPFGIVGLETAFSLMYTHFVKTGILSLERLVELMAINPRKRFGIPIDDGFTVWKLDEKYKVDPKDFLSMGHATPFDGDELYARCVMTVCGDKIAYKAD